MDPVEELERRLGDANYPSHNRRSLALVFYNDEFDDGKMMPLRYTANDVDKYKNVLNQLGFDVRLCRNKNRQAILNELDNVKHNRSQHCRDLKYYDTFLLHFITHGSNGIIHCYDRQPINLKDEVFSRFSNKNWNEFKGKPKIIFIEACRGDDDDRGVPLSGPPERSTPLSEVEYSKMLASYSDMLIVYASERGYRAYESKFIRAVTDVFQVKGDTEDVVSMLTMVNKLVNDQNILNENDEFVKISPVIRSTLCRKVFFVHTPSRSNEQPELDELGSVTSLGPNSSSPSPQQQHGDVEGGNSEDTAAASRSEQEVQESPEVKVSEPHLVAQVGSFVELPVEIHHGRPEAQVTWFHNTRRLHVDDLRLGPDDTLVIHSAKFEDAGTYKVVAKSDAGEADGSVELTIEGAPKLRKPDRENVRLQKGDDYTLSVDFSGYPNPKIEWKFPESVDKHYLSPKQFTSRCICTLRKVTIEDVGEYTVTLSNKYGEVSKSFNVNVLL